MAGKRTTLRQVAERAGVSQAAVSLVFRGRHKGNVSEPTRLRIIAAAEELGYRPDRIAQSLRGASTAMIGVITDEIATAPFAGAILQGALDRAWEERHVMAVVNVGVIGSEHYEQKVTAAVEELLDRRVDGLLYATMGRDVVPDVPALREHAVAYVNCEARGIGPCVLPDDCGGGAAAVRAAIEAGHRRIALLGGPLGHPATVERERGGRAAFAEYGIEPWRFGNTSGEIDDGFDLATGLLSAVERPTALVCWNDRLAAGALLAASRLGLTVPDDVSIVGYDDQELLADRVRPALSTIALPHYEMGRLGVSLVLDSLAGRDVPADTLYELPCPYVSRESLGPPPRA